MISPTQAGRFAIFPLSVQAPLFAKPLSSDHEDELPCSSATVEGGRAQLPLRINDIDATFSLRTRYFHAIDRGTACEQDSRQPCSQARTAAIPSTNSHSRAQSRSK